MSNFFKTMSIRLNQYIQNKLILCQINNSRRAVRMYACFLMRHDRTRLASEWEQGLQNTTCHL